MAFNEIDSFIVKFKNLWHAGLKASLSIEAEQGQAHVTLKAGLGHIPPPFHPHDGQVHRQYRGPSYQRRQEKRQAARSAAAVITSLEADQELPVQQVPDSKDSEKDDLAAEKAPEALAESIKNLVEAEKVSESYECQLCDFKSNWQTGLNIHITKKHGIIEQLDGNAVEIDELCVEKYEETKHYWERGWLGTGYQTFIDATKIIEGSELSEEVKRYEMDKLLEARKTAIGPSFRFYPPWNLRT